MRTPTDEVIEQVLSVYKSWGRTTTAKQMRDGWDALFSKNDDYLSADYTEIEGVRVAWIGDVNLPRDRIFIYLHGGGYQVGSIRSHYEMVSRISAKSKIIGLAIAYSRAPEHSFPTPVMECVKVYKSLLRQGVKAKNIAFIGDSAGANLAISTVLMLTDKGLPYPAMLALMSPWTDLEARGKSYETRSKLDPIHQRGMILRMAEIYLAGHDPKDPLASPLNADLNEFPPTLIQVGDRETVLDDARDFAQKLELAGIEVDCQVWDGMIHVFQQFPDILPEADQALAKISDFLISHLTSKVSNHKIEVK
ncbi:MAG: esterase [Robiginitomaculum sp.]|nr:MAG: esterase [Robiginitomaculum sp.]